MLGFARQSFYEWLADPIGQRDWEDAHLANVLLDLHRDNPPFGYRFLCDELMDRVTQSARTGCTGSAGDRIWPTTTKKGKKVAGKTPGPAVSDDLVEHDFSAPAPDVLWLTDFTEPHADRKALSRVAQGRLLEPHHRLRLQPEAHGGPGVCGTAPRAGPFRSRSFQRLLSMNALAGSMGRVASAADNAAMESFHSLLQKNVLDQRRVWETREQLHLAIVTWIEHTDNNRRRQRRLGKLTPVEFELAFAATDAA